jgi:hypothetical protein
MKRNPRRGKDLNSMLDENDTTEPKRALKRIGGSMSDDWNRLIADQVFQALWIKNSDQKTLDGQIDATLAVLMGISPQDELEGMLAAQLVASHNAAMECYRRAMLADQTFESRRENLNQANKLSRTWATLIEALNRYRGKGEQKVTVEHVHVHAGGQAMVGTVETPRGKSLLRQEDLNAKQITHAPEPTLLSTDQTQDALPIARNEEWPVPTARRKIHGSTER